MKLNELAQQPPPSAASPEVFHKLGAITRQLHDSLHQLGLAPQLQRSAQSLPDARSRLNYIAEKTGAAAIKVLNLVDEAKADQAGIAEKARAIAAAMVADPVRAVASGAVMNFVADVDSATARIDTHLTDIMMAQDFHDLTGQVVAKVVALASDLEASLLKLLLQAAPPEQAVKRAEPAPASAHLQGPVIDAAGRTDVVTDQGEVDDLLASLGF